MDFTALGADLPNLIIGISLIVLMLGLIFGALGVAGYFFLQFFKWRGREEHALEYILLQVAVPRDNEVKIDAMEQLFSSLYTLYHGKANLLDFDFLKIQEHISFEIVGQPGDIRFYVSVPQKHKDLVEKQIHGTYAGAVITEVEDYNIFSEKGEVSFASLKLKHSNYAPIKVYRDFAVDPMSQLTSALAKMSEGEAAAIQFVVSPAGNKWRSLGRKFVSKTKKNEADPEKAKFNVDSKSLEGIENKTSKPGFSTSIRLVACAPSKAESKLLLDNIKSAFAQFSSDQNAFGSDKIRIQSNFMTDFIYRFQPLFAKPSVLTSEELATVFHFPNKSVETPNIFSNESKISNFVT